MPLHFINTYFTTDPFQKHLFSQNLSLPVSRVDTDDFAMLIATWLTVGKADRHGALFIASEQQ